MKTIIQYTTFNPYKNRIQHYLKETKNLAYYQDLQKIGVISNLEIIEL